MVFSSFFSLLSFESFVYDVLLLVRFVVSPLSFLVVLPLQILSTRFDFFLSLLPKREKGLSYVEKVTDSICNLFFVSL